MYKTLSKPKLIGGIGSISMVLAITPYMGLVAGLVGIILVLVSLNMFSKIFNDFKIFRSALISFILAIVAGVLVFLTVGVAFFSLLSTMGDSFSPHMFTKMGIGSVFVFLILYVVLIFSAYYLKSAFYLLSSYTKINLYKTGGLLYFIGTILLVVVIGVLINLVAWVLIAVAFFTTPEEIESPA